MSMGSFDEAISEIQNLLELNKPPNRANAAGQQAR